MPATLADQGFALRSEADEDVPFLRRLYISTRWEELAITGWSEGEKQAFLESQFALQRHHYRTYYPGTDWGVLEKEGVPAGRLYVEPRTDTLAVIDISLLPEWRGRGIGTTLLQAVCAAARSAGKSVNLAVERSNPALRLYRRLGFQDVSDEGVYLFMEWHAPSADPSRAKVS